MHKEPLYKYKIVNRNGKYGATLFDMVIIPFEYQELRAFNKNYIAIAKKNDKYGAINSQNQIVIPFELDDVSFFMGDLLIVERDGKNGVYNSQGKLLIPCEYDHIDDFMDYCDDESDNFAIIEKDKKYGLLNYKCNIVIPIQYDYLTYSMGDLFIAQKDCKFGIVNFYNDLILPFEYNSIDSIEEIINDNELMFDIINNSIYDNKLKLVRQGNKYGLLCKDNERNILPFIYTDLQDVIYHISSKRLLSKEVKSTNCILTLDNSI